MNHTENYHLPQWEKEDRVLMEDFNQMCLDMEAGIMDARTRAEEGDAAVQTVANAAMEKANAAFSPSKMPYAVGSYIGVGTKWLDIYLGFRPSFVIIAGQENHGQPGGIENFVVAGATSCSGLVSFKETGFSVYYHSASYPQLSISGKLYYYIAFR